MGDEPYFTLNCLVSVRVGLLIQSFSRALNSFTLKVVNIEKGEFQSNGCRLFVLDVGIFGKLNTRLVGDA